MKNTFKLLWVFCILVSLVACEGGTTFSKSLNNQTDETITLKFTIDGNETEISIPSMTTGSVWIDDRDGFFINETYTCTSEFETIEATVSNNKLLTLNLLDNDNWVLQLDQGSRNEDADCLITVTQADLQ